MARGRKPGVPLSPSMAGLFREYCDTHNRRMAAERNRAAGAYDDSPLPAA